MADKPTLWDVQKTAGKSKRGRQRGKARLYLHPGQLKVWNSTKRFVYMLAGTQSGKTSFGPWWLKREIERCGPGDYIAVTPTFPLLNLKLLPEFLAVFRDTLQLGVWRAGDKVFSYHDGQTRIIFGSARNPESLESATAKAAWCDELGQDDFRLDSWEAVQRRLSLHQGRILGTTTIYNLGWLKQQIYDPWARGELPDTDIIQFESIANPAFPLEEYQRVQAVLPSWKFRMFYQGFFERPPGMIYSDFADKYRDEGGHIVRPFDIPSEWPRYNGTDFGAVNLAHVWLVRDPQNGVSYIYDESLTGGKSTAQHASEAKAKAEGVNMKSWYGGAKSEVQQRMDWEAEGIYMLEPEISDVEAGIDRIISLFKQDLLYIFDTCRGVLDELGTYSRELGDDGEPTEQIRRKETFHLLDALRYAAQALTVPASSGVVVGIAPRLMGEGYESRRIGWSRRLRR